MHVNTYATELALPSFCLLLKRGTTAREGEEIRETGWEVVCGTGGRARGRGFLVAGTSGGAGDIGRQDEGGAGNGAARRGDAIVVVAMVVVSRIPRGN